MTTDAKILSALRASPDGVSGAQLAEQLAISRAAVWARIEDLRKAGYDIAASPHFGYKLEHSPDALHADDLLARVAATPSSPNSSRSATGASPSRIIGRDIRVFEETSSTNDVAEKLARDGVAEGVVIFAESQTKGRGRLGRKWMSPPRKGLWFSVLLRPNFHPQETTQLTVISATAVRRAIKNVCGLAADIKWPNDILIGGKKAAGILTEMSAEVDRVRHVILGIGLDVNLEPHEFPAELKAIATSLRAACGEPVSRPELAVEILRELDLDYARIRAGKFSEVADEWESACVTIGKNVTVHVGDRKFRGRAESLDDDGALLVRTEHGHLERVIGGDVILEK